MAEMRAKLGLDNAEFNTGLQQAQVKLKEFNENLANPGASIGGFLKSLPAIGGFIALIDVGIATVKSFREGIESAFRSAMKRQELIADFQAFYGSVEASRAKVKEFSDYARHTSFSTDDVAEGALRLEVLTNGALQGAKALHMVGDVATDTDKTFTEVATTVGVLYSRIASGGAIERPLLALEKMGVMTPVVSAKIKDMISAGESTAETWKVVEGELKQFEGTTENVAKTAGGSLDKIGKNYNAIKTALAMPFVEMITPVLRRMSEESDKTRSSLSSWMGVFQSFLRGVAVVWFVATQSGKTAVSMAQSLYTVYEGLFKLVKTSGAQIFEAVIDASNGDFKMALSSLRVGAQAAIDITEQTGKKLAALQADCAKDMKADFEAMKQSVMAVDANTPPPVDRKQIDFDPEGGNEPTPGPSELKSKQSELDALNASARERTMTDLERINDMEARRVELLAKAAALKAKSDKLDPAHDQGPIDKLKAQMLDAQIGAARLAEQIGQAQETRDQKIATLKQKIQEHADKLLDREERIAALRKEEKELDVNNADEEISLAARARKGEIEDQIDELQKKSQGGHLEADALRKVGGGTKGIDYSAMLGLDDSKKQTQLQEKIEANTAKMAAASAATAPTGGSNIKTPVVSSVALMKFSNPASGKNLGQPPADFKKQTDLQTKMVKSLANIEDMMSNPSTSSSALATFGN